MDKLLEYFNGDELAANVWRSKYAQDNETHYDQMHWRMAGEFNRIDEKYQETELNIHRAQLSEYGKNRADLNEIDIYNLFKDFKYIIPQGSVMSTLGTNKLASLSNCVVIPSPEDSYNSIMYADTQLVSLYKRRCGVGVDISNLRPNGTKVQNAANTTSGAVSFMNRFSNTTREVAMNGRRK